MADLVTRFAPSPTGYLHVGGARTALFNWLLTKHFNGEFLLRIEDTDRLRSTETACAQLLEDLRWLGLHWDNSALVFQSKRKQVYDALIDSLIARGQAYEAFESPEELEAERRRAEAQKTDFVYRRRAYSPQDLERFGAEGRKPVIRLAMPVKEYQFDDAVLKKPIVMPAKEAQDFVIRKADGMPTYHFAVVVDDQEMNVTHILRGQEHLKNTFYHLALQDALHYRRPTYGHLPIILNVDNSKMGKRDRDKKIRRDTLQKIKTLGVSGEALAAEAGLDRNLLDAWLKDEKRQLNFSQQAAVMRVIGLKDSDLPEVFVHDFRRNGYLPEALLNFLALLGWSPGGNLERMSIDELINQFSVDGIGKGNARFARDKLMVFNTEACAAASTPRLLAATRDFLSVNPDSPLNRAADAELKRLYEMKKGFRTLRELEEATRFFFTADEDIGFDPIAVEKVLRKNDNEGLATLAEIKRVLHAIVEWAHAPLEAAVKNYSESRQIGLGKVAQPIRVAITGSTVSPPIIESLEFLGRQRSLNRIQRCLSAFGG